MAGPGSEIDALTIGEAARRIGLTPRAVRYYEQVGLIEAASRSGRNYRLYDDKALHELQFVARCRAIGLSATDIRALRTGMPAQGKKGGRAELLLEQLKLVETQIRELFAVRREFRRQLGAERSLSHPGRVLEPAGSRRRPALGSCARGSGEAASRRHP